MKTLFAVLVVGLGAMGGPVVVHAQATSAPVLDTIEVNEFDLVYRDVGEGDPLVLLHKFFGSGDDFESVLDELSPHYRLIIPDLRGHGRSTNPSGRFTHRQAALDIFALLDHLDLGAVRAMGVSTGGMTLLHMATSQPDRIDAMVLLGATSYFPVAARPQMRGYSPADLSPEQRAGLSEQALALNRQFAAFADSYDDMNFTAPLLSTIRAETLIVHGDRDRFFPVSIPVAEYEAIPDSYLWIVPNGEHIPLIRTERGDRMLTENMLEFFAGDWRR